MARRTVDERIADIEAKENALKQQKKKLKAEQSKQRRNARTKKLIELGAEVKKIANVTDDELLSDDYSQADTIKKLIETLTLIPSKENEIANEIFNSIEAVIGRDLELEDVETFNKFISFQERRGQYFSNAMNKTPYNK